MTRLNELLGTEFPIVQGGMANIATAEFAAAVSNAGALGLIGGGGMDAAGFRESIRRCRTLTDRPFGVNIMLMHPQAEEMADIAAEERVAVITTGAGNPARFIPRWKESGAKVFPVVAAVALARLVLLDPHTLILDEATSLLDPRAARTLERTLSTALAGRTVIEVAHRLYTAADADRVAVVMDGRIVELGTHDELVALGGEYASLWQAWNQE